LLLRAQHYSRRTGDRPPTAPTLSGVTIANLFTEPSTRTRVSFELAGRRLGAEVVNLELQLSSRVKGETMLDTIYTLQALHFDVFVIRDAEPGVLGLVAENVAPEVSVLSAGEAHLSHPTQGLLDALTIRQHKGDLGSLRIAIVGDIRHSRVARSAYHAFRILEAREIRIVAPPALMPERQEFAGCPRFQTLEEGLAGVDVVMMLRIQKERFAETSVPDGEEYFARYGLTAARLARAHPEAIVMHPQPMNRGIEIASEVADGPQSVIRDQVSNGVAVRMAVLESVSGRLNA
jgi:aspartate carbamoyltransferase catalytic subunit